MKNRNWGWILRRFCLVIFDILAVNLAYYLALVVRFYVNGEYRAVAVNRYIPAFWRFAPWYTVICLLVFFAFKLYNSRWRQAGLHDLNRILMANLVTAAVHAAGTILFFTRMPITYYLIGAVLQFVFIAISRFFFRIWFLEKARLGRRNLNVMIVGTGETAQILRRQIENNNLARPVVIFSYRDHSGGMIDGIPVVSDLNKIGETIKKYGISVVILADSLMPPEVRARIRGACEGVEVQDFSGYLQNEGPGLTPARVLEYAAGKVILSVEGKESSFSNGEQALMSLHGKYNVTRIGARENALYLELAPFVLNDLRKPWVIETEKATGEAISFF